MAEKKVQQVPARVIALNIFPSPYEAPVYEFALDDFSTVRMDNFDMFVKTGWVASEDLKQTKRYSFGDDGIPVTVTRHKSGRQVFGDIPRNPARALVFNRACQELMDYIETKVSCPLIAARLMGQFYVA